MQFDVSNVGRPSADTAIPPAFKAAAAGAGFARELTLKLADRDRDARVEAPVRDEPVREAREPEADTDRAADAVDDDAPVDHAADDSGRDDDTDTTESAAHTDVSTDDDVMDAQALAAAVETTGAEAEADAGEADAAAVAQATTPVMQPTDQPATPAVETSAPTAQTQSQSQTPAQTQSEAADRSGETAETASSKPQPEVTGVDVPASEEALLAALESILGPEAQTLLDTAAAPAGDELPGVLNMPEGFAALGGEPTLIAHMLTKRINALQQRLDRLQQMLQGQPAGNGASAAATLDPAVATRLGFADNTTVTDIINGLMRQTEARLDAVMNANARAAATPATLAGDGARAGGTANGSFASQLSGDAAAPSGSSTTSQNAAAHNAASLAARAAPAQTPAGIQVAIQLVRAVQDGLDRINIRLNPAELGRVDVKLELGHDGRAIAVVTADRQETLDLLQRDARGLERALQDAGLRADSGSLSFNLRQHGQDSGQMAGGHTAPGGTGAGDSAEGQLDAVATQTVDPNRLLDISV